MNPNELEELMSELVQAVMMVMQSGEEMPDELQGAIAQTLDNLMNRIDEARTQGAQQAGPTEPTVSNDAQLLWVLSGQQPQAFISYLRTFPTPDTQALLSNPTMLNATIEQLNQMIPQGQLQVIDGIPHADLNSSNVWGANYDKNSGKMKVRFQGGSEYEYDGVPENIFNAFISGNAAAKTSGKNKYGEWWVGKSPSIGAGFAQYIKAGGFPYRKIK